MEETGKRLTKLNQNDIESESPYFAWMKSVINQFVPMEIILCDDNRL
jgi:hypothetical protein